MMQNKIQKAFGQICADNALKDTTKKAVLEKAYGKQVRKPFTTKRIYSYGLLASFALCCIIFMGKYLYFTPTAVMRMDKNWQHHWMCCIKIMNLPFLKYWKPNGCRIIFKKMKCFP